MSKERPKIEDYHYRLVKGQSENKKTGKSYLGDCEDHITHLESKLKKNLPSDEEMKQITVTIALLNSMIHSGEQHSKSSLMSVKLAFQSLNKS